MNRITLHQGLEALGQGGLCTADRTQKVEHLFGFLHAHGRMAKEGHDLFDGVFHAEKVMKSCVTTERAIAK